MNTRSTTWRNLSAEDKLIAEDDPAGLLITYPTLIKRPVIEAGLFQLLHRLTASIAILQPVDPDQHDFPQPENPRIRTLPLRAFH